jgi:hypothetical protein
MLKARWYDATLGRFLSLDPNPSNDDGKQGQTLNANFYLYTNNNPLIRKDSSGQGFYALEAYMHWVYGRGMPVWVNLGSYGWDIITTPRSPFMNLVNSRRGRLGNHYISSAGIGFSARGWNAWGAFGAIEGSVRGMLTITRTGWSFRGVAQALRDRYDWNVWNAAHRSPIGKALTLYGASSRFYHWSRVRIPMDYYIYFRGVAPVSASGRW